MLFTTNNIINNEDIMKINEYFQDYEEDTVKDLEKPEEEITKTPVALYLSSLVSSRYQKSIEDIENTTMGNKRTRKRNLQQVMKESFFAGANRFGNNFIA